MKKKILALCLVVVLAITAVTGATLAYFTDVDKAENVFTVGNIDIIQRESQRVLEDRVIVDDKAPADQEANIESFENNKKAAPGVLNKLEKAPITVEGYNFKIRSLEGNYIDKIVSVYNNSNEPAYMRTIIAIPNMNGFDDDKDATYNPLHWNYLDATDFNNVGWDWNGNKDANVDQDDKIAAVKIDGVEYDIYVATHNQAVPAKSWTSPSLVGFYLHDTVGHDENGYFFINGAKEKKDLNEWMTADEQGNVALKILVATQACQIDGFADAWEALDTAFGDITATNHPWISTT